MTIRMIDVRNPLDGSPAGQVRNHTRDEVAATVRWVRGQQPEWDALGPGRRGIWLRRLRDWLLDHSDEITDVVASETGKVRSEAALEVPMVCDMINYWTSNADKFLSAEHPFFASPIGVAKRLTQTWRPYPVVGVITPWNVPLLMPGMDSVPALLAGAAVVVKPSEVTPLSALQLDRGWRDIGAPPVFSIVTGAAATGSAVVDNVDYIQFTGSTRTGRAIAQAAAVRLTPYSLELGGKDAAIVLADADLDRAVNGVTWGALANAGQLCVSTERVYVEAPIYDAFVTRIAAKVSSLKASDADETAPDIGAMATEAQLNIVQRHVDDAVAHGATVLTGGAPTGRGTCFQPTVLVDVDHTMTCMRDETFGPTIPIMKVRDADEAIALANDSPYGLSAVVWSRNRDRARAVARRLQVGTVNINDSMPNLFTYPLAMGGWKQSGIGSRLGGATGIRKYCRTQSFTEPRLPTLSDEIVWFPYTPGRARIARAVLHALASRNPLRAFGIDVNIGRATRRHTARSESARKAAPTCSRT